MYNWADIKKIGIVLILLNLSNHLYAKPLAFKEKPANQQVKSEFRIDTFSFIEEDIKLPPKPTIRSELLKADIEIDRLLAVSKKIQLSKDRNIKLKEKIRNLAAETDPAMTDIPADYLIP